MHQSTLEQVIEAASGLPLEDQRRLREWLEEEEKKTAMIREGARGRAQEEERLQKTHRWLAAHRSQYLRQWVALDGDCLISHSKDGREVLERAKASGIKSLFIEFLAEEELPFGGW